MDWTDWRADLSHRLGIQIPVLLEELPIAEVGGGGASQAPSLPSPLGLGLDLSVTRIGQLRSRLYGLEKVHV
ncbi:hypothetical protein ACLOJK_000239 [Asimina triloba]